MFWHLRLKLDVSLWSLTVWPANRALDLNILMIVLFPVPGGPEIKGILPLGFLLEHAARRSIMMTIATAGAFQCCSASHVLCPQE